MVKKEKDQSQELEIKETEKGLRASGNKNTPAGFDSVEDGDIKMPRLAILQGLSQLCVDGKAKMGQLANSLTKEIYGEEIEFIPLFMFKTRAMFEQGKGLVMMSRDNLIVTMTDDEHAEYMGKPVEEVPGAAWNGNEPPTFNLVYNFPVLLVGNLRQFPVALSLMKTAVKPAKELLSMARFSGEDMFARVYSIKSKTEKNEKGTYCVPVIEFKRRCTDEEYVIAKRFFDSLYRRKEDISVDLEEENTTTTTEKK